MTNSNDLLEFEEEHFEELSERFINKNSELWDESGEPSVHKFIEEYDSLWTAFLMDEYVNYQPYDEDDDK